MIAHTSIHVSDFSHSKDFYRKALGPLGYTQNMELGHAAGFNDGKNTDFARREYWPGYYAAFVRDPDGHNVEAVWFDYDAVATAAR
jgi:catechol 2,3-dioxygenase-like lactoylglutathione lyase family enzyme